jgi:hypothetical protein
MMTTSLTDTSDQMKQFFDPCVDIICDMVTRQMNQIRRRNARTKVSSTFFFFSKVSDFVKNLFLVGGFGRSKYLKQQLELYLGKLERVNIRCPDTAWTAVVRGAVLTGVEKALLPNLTTVSPCKRHYAVCADKVFSDVHHSGQHRVENPYKTNNDLAKGQLHWLFSKGDLIFDNEPTERSAVLKVEFGENTNRSGRLAIYWYDDDDYPRPDSIYDASNGKFCKLI